MTHLIHCSCGEVIVKSQGPDTKVRAKIVVFKDNAAFAVCKGCDSEVAIPLQLNEDLLKSMSAAPEKSRHIPLYVRTRR
jgi:ribosomal protein S27E